MILIVKMNKKKHSRFYRKSKIILKKLKREIKKVLSYLPFADDGMIF